MRSECICNVCLISETNQRVQIKFDKEMLTLKFPMCRLQAPLATCFTVRCILIKANEEFYYSSKKWLAFCSMDSFPGLNVQVSEATHLLLSGTGFENDWMSTSTSLVSFHGVDKNKCFFSKVNRRSKAMRVLVPGD
jgi:hypothetical protein